VVQSVSYQRAHRSQGRPGECDATFGVAGCISSEEANTIDAGAVTTPQVDADTLADAYRRHGRLLVQRLALIVGDADEARDLAQETFTRAAKHWPLPPGQPVHRWLAVVGVRLALNERRRRRRWGFLPVRDQDAVWAMTVNPDVWRALMHLDLESRAALVLTVLDGYSQSEVAELLDVPRGTAAGCLSMARDRLRRILEDQAR
jgi:RNA polymerase sigma factor (sigma-70 family)